MVAVHPAALGLVALPLLLGAFALGFDIYTIQQRRARGGPVSRWLIVRLAVVCLLVIGLVALGLVQLFGR